MQCRRDPEDWKLFDLNNRSLPEHEIIELSHRTHSGCRLTRPMSTNTDDRRKMYLQMSKFFPPVPRGRTISSDIAAMFYQSLFIRIADQLGKLFRTLGQVYSDISIVRVMQEPARSIDLGRRRRAISGRFRSLSKELLCCDTKIPASTSLEQQVASNVYTDRNAT